MAEKSFMRYRDVLRMMQLMVLTGFLLASQTFAKDFITDTYNAAKKGVQDIGGALETAAQDTGKALETAGQDTGKALETAGQDTGKALETAGQDTGKALETAGQDVGHEVERAGQNADDWVKRDFVGSIQNISEFSERIGTDVWDTAGKAVNDTGHAVEKAYSDTEHEVKRVPGHLQDTASALTHYAENMANGIGDGLSEAERRVRQGKFVDAVWHLSFAPVTAQEKAASQAFLESGYLRTVGQVAANVYGGPGGAAAFSAWLVYRETNDLSLAVRTGVITGLSAAAAAAAAEIPRDEAYSQLKRVIVMSAIGGAGVAAAGGDEKTVLKGFLAGGAMVVLQDYYEDTTRHQLDPQASKNVLAYCGSATPSGTCTPVPPEAWASDAQGNKYIDMRKVDPRVPAVGLKNGPIGVNENSFFLKDIVSKVPGMQAGAVLHDTWHMTWAPQGVLQTTFVPAFAVAYYGTVAPLQGQIAETAVETALRTRAVYAGDPSKSTPLPVSFTYRTATEAQILGLTEAQSAANPTSSTSGLKNEPESGSVVTGANVGYSAQSRHFWIGFSALLLISSLALYIIRTVRKLRRVAR